MRRTPYQVLLDFDRAIDRLLAQQGESIIILERLNDASLTPALDKARDALSDLREAKRSIDDARRLEIARRL